MGRRGHLPLLESEINEDANENIDIAQFFFFEVLKYQIKLLFWFLRRHLSESVSSIRDSAQYNEYFLQKYVLCFGWRSEKNGT